MMEGQRRLRDALRKALSRAAAAHEACKACEDAESAKAHLAVFDQFSDLVKDMKVLLTKNRAELNRIKSEERSRINKMIGDLQIDVKRHTARVIELRAILRHEKGVRDKFKITISWDDQRAPP